MTQVHFNNEQMPLKLSEAKDFITSSKDRDHAITAYKNCWETLRNKDKIQLEKWWNNNHKQFKFNSTSTIDTPIVYTLKLSKEEEKSCIEELEDSMLEIELEDNLFDIDFE